MKARFTCVCLVRVGESSPQSLGKQRSTDVCYAWILNRAIYIVYISSACAVCSHILCYCFLLHDLHLEIIHNSYGTKEKANTEGYLILLVIDSSLCHFFWVGILT